MRSKYSSNKITSDQKKLHLIKENQIKSSPLSSMIGFNPAVASVRAANKPDGPDPTITTVGGGMEVSSCCVRVLVAVVDSEEGKRG